MSNLITRQYVLNTNSNNPIGCSVCTECGARVRVRLKPFCVIENVSDESNHYPHCTESGEWLYMYTLQEEQKWWNNFQEKGIINNDLSWFLLDKAIKEERVTKQEAVSKTLNYIKSKSGYLADKLEPRVKELVGGLGSNGGINVN